MAKHSLRKDLEYFENKIISLTTVHSTVQSIIRNVSEELHCFKYFCQSKDTKLMFTEKKDFIMYILGVRK